MIFNQKCFPGFHPLIFVFKPGVSSQEWLRSTNRLDSRLSLSLKVNRQQGFYFGRNKISYD